MPTRLGQFGFHNVDPATSLPRDIYNRGRSTLSQIGQEVRRGDLTNWPSLPEDQPPLNDYELLQLKEKTSSILGDVPLPVLGGITVSRKMGQELLEGTKISTGPNKVAGDLIPVYRGQKGTDFPTPTPSKLKKGDEDLRAFYTPQKNYAPSYPLSAPNSTKDLRLRFQYQKENNLPSTPDEVPLEYLLSHPENQGRNVQIGFLAMKNPYVTSASESATLTKSDMGRLEKEGYDGVIGYSDFDDLVKQYKGKENIPTEEAVEMVPFNKNQWVQMADEPPIHKSKTGISDYDNMIANPAHFLAKENKKWTTVEMSPDEYIRKVEEGFYRQDKRFWADSGRGARSREEIASNIKETRRKKALKYAKQWMDNPEDFFPTGLLDYTGEMGTFIQEGLHRAYAAKFLKYDKIPVLVVSKPPRKVRGR